MVNQLMNNKMTSVYVPVETPDIKGVALLMSLLMHGILLGSVIFFHHEAPPPPMETMLITPDQLAEIEGQIQENQQQNRGGALATTSATSSQKMADNTKKTEPDPKIRQMMNDIAKKEAQWREEQALFAEQIDKEMQAEQQAFIDELNREQAETEDAIKEFRQAENNLDEIRENIRKTSEAYKKDLNENQEKPQKIESIELGKNKQKSDNNTSVNNSSRSGGGSAGGATSYKKLIVGIIDRNWSPPTNSHGKRLTASFNISPSGTISNIQISGGDETFKNSLLQAIQNSSPLPPPPSESYDSFSHNNFTFVAD